MRKYCAIIADLLHAHVVAQTYLRCVRTSVFVHRPTSADIVERVETLSTVYPPTSADAQGAFILAPLAIGRRQTTSRRPMHKDAIMNASYCLSCFDSINRGM